MKEERGAWQQLAASDDPRLKVSPLTGVNAYGIAYQPRVGVEEWGSGTATECRAADLSVAERGYQLWCEHSTEWTHQCLKEGLWQALDLERESHDMALYPSGTAALVAGVDDWDCSVEAVVMCHPDETGSRVLEGWRQRWGGREVRLDPIPVRGEDGKPRAPDALAQDYRACVENHVSRGDHVVLVMTDVTKSGHVAPDEACALACHRDYPDHVRVLVDGCQARLSALRIRRYLAHGWRVALTGSKFMGGPPFSGLLLAPRVGCGQMPEAWTEQNRLSTGAFLRWWVALEAMQTWRACDKSFLPDLLTDFRERLVAASAGWSGMWMEPVGMLGRPAVGDDWDNQPTLFPFLLVDPKRPERWLDREALQSLFLDLPVVGRRIRGRWGQPVHLGAGRWGLRICLGARQLMPWLQSPRSQQALSDSLGVCLALLDETLWLAGRVG